jgi:hypothetical protein
VTDTPVCWCAYGGDGLEDVHPQCPIHGTEPTPKPVDQAVLEPCSVCAEEREDCHACDGSGEDEYGERGECIECGGAGERIPAHCCQCGGGEYDCQCCRRCGGYAGTCGCPIPVQLHDGSTLTLEGQPQ